MKYLNIPSRNLSVLVLLSFIILALFTTHTVTLAGSEYSPLDVFTPYPGARISTEINQQMKMVLKAMTSGHDVPVGELVVLMTRDPLNKVIQFYKDNPLSDGWTSILELEKGGTNFVGIWQREGESAQMLLSRDAGDTIIVLGYGKKVTEIKKESSWTLYTEEDGLIEDIATVIAEGKDGSIWFGTGDGLIQFINNQWKTYTFGPLESGIKDIAVASSGDLWIGTWLNGLMHFDGQVWENITENEGLQNDRVSSISIDNFGRIWVSSLHNKGGVCVYSGNNWTKYTEETGLPSNYVHSVDTGYNNEVWAGTKAGAASFSQNTWKTYTSEDGLLDDEIDEIAVDANSNVWAVSDLGVNLFAGNRWKTFPYGGEPFEKKVFQTTTTPDGYVWFGTKEGITCFDGSNWHHLTEADGLPDSYILSVLVTSKNMIWFGTMNSGVGVGENPFN